MDFVARDDVGLLVELGFIALSAGLDRDAERIFEGVRAARPEQEAGPLGLAMTAMARTDLDAAIAILRALPPSDAASTYLGMALMRRGDLGEARSMLEHVERTARGTPFGDLASAALASPS